MIIAKMESDNNISIHCNVCELWSVKFFTDIISNSDVDLQISNSVITNGCIAKLFAFLNSNRDTAGVVAGTSDGRVTDNSHMFYEIITRIASLCNNPNFKLKEKFPLIRNIKRSVNTALTKNMSNCCMIAQIMYCPIPLTAAERKQVSRQNTDLRQAEKLTTARRERKKRAENPEYREAEKIATGSRNKKRRTENPEFREAEKTATAARKSTRRAQDPEYREAEKIATAAREKQRRHQHQQGLGQTVDTLISDFHPTVAEGPIYICSSCDQLFYKHSVKNSSSLYSVSYTHLRAHETDSYLVCRLLL